MYVYLFLDVSSESDFNPINQLDQLMSVDIRAPSLHAGSVWSTDYLVTAHSSATCIPKLGVFTGNNECVYTFNVEIESNTS